ncbi:MAG: urea transporter [Bacteroidales bacterium]|nr:urea transporter [Bacteroidales bacterium]
MKTKIDIKELYSGILNSYSQIFFSNNQTFGILLFLVSFFDLWSGLGGLLAVVSSNGFAYALGFDKYKIRKGMYAYNGLLTGLGIGLYFQPSLVLYSIIIAISLFIVFLNVNLEAWFGKYRLPFLSIPFIIGIWIIDLSGSSFLNVWLSDRSIYFVNSIYGIGGKTLVDLYNWWNTIPFFYSLKVYFLSLGAIFFQYNVFAGMLIAIGILIYSRIALTLSILGFYTAYYFYSFVGADLSELSYTYIGFNFILTSMSLGGFFLVPNKYSYLWTVIILPLVVLITLASMALFANFQLSIYALPFNLIVIVFLYSIKLRVPKKSGLKEVIVQQYSPEKNLYFYNNANRRFGELQYISIALPFSGMWDISQGHAGEHTHRGEWQHAWDFIIRDRKGLEYKNEGDYPEDYFCYDKNVLAPADGIVQEVQNGIPDNIIGDMNLVNNWGNTIIIKHVDYLYTKYSHLKLGSISVKNGDFVRKGQVIAKVGNSGRSPYPHLHFQIQATPYIGSKTLDYPLARYISQENDGKFKLHLFEKPLQDQKIGNIQSNSLLKNALHFIPGQEFKFEIENQGKKEIETWEIQADTYNNSYFYCSKTNSYAYFYSDDNLLYFKNYVGDKNAALFHFYLAFFKIQTGYYKDLEIEDQIPANQIFRKSRLFFQDFIAPFYMYLHAKYRLKTVSIDDELMPSEIKLESQINNFVFNRKVDAWIYSITINEQGIKEVVLNRGNQKIRAKQVYSN